MKIDSMRAMSSVKTEEPDTSVRRVKRQDTWGASSISSAARDPYDLDLSIVPNGLTVKDQTGSVSCPPCGETNNGCNQTQACSANCSGNANCS